MNREIEKSHETIAVIQEEKTKLQIEQCWEKRWEHELRVILEFSLIDLMTEQIQSLKGSIFSLNEKRIDNALINFWNIGGYRAEWQ